MDTFFFYSSKIVWQVISPDLILVLLLVSGLVLLWCKAYAKAKTLLSMGIGFILFITILPIGDWIYLPLEKRFPPQESHSLDHHPIDGIIMLGGAEALLSSKRWHRFGLNDASERYIEFIHLIQTYPQATRLFSGGSHIKYNDEAVNYWVAKQIFSRLNIDTRQILFENQSRNTYENSMFSHQMVKPSPGERWILVTSAAHMPRAVGVFRKAGWDVIPYPVDYKTIVKDSLRVNLNFSGNLARFTLAAKEWTGLLAYYLTGKTDRLFPGP